MKRLIVIGVLFLVGCESMPRGETAWQLLHLTDTLQTINGPAEDDCYRESGGLTKLLITETPTKGQALAWGVGWGALHYGVSRHLDNNAPGWVLGVWQIFTTGEVALTIHSNNKIGIKPWGDNDHSKLKHPDRC